MKGLLALALLGCAGSGAGAPADPGPELDDSVAFSVVVLPDTQIYAWQYPETFEAQLRWVAEHREEYGIVFVTHVGDIVQWANAPEQWQAAEAAYDWIEDIDLPHGFSAGGHDFGVSGDAGHDSSCSTFADVDCAFTDFNAHFGAERYADRDWYLGTSPSGRSSAQRVTAGDWELLFLHLPQDPGRDEVDWAKEVLDANPGTLAHLTTHRHLFDYRLTEDLPSPLNLLPAGRFNAVTYRFGGQELKFHDSLSAEEVFEELLVAHPNLWTLQCGHVDAEFKQASTNAAGLPIHEVLTDFQDMADGGGGWLRLMEYKPGVNQVHVRTYSPVFDAWRDNGDGFEHSLDLLEYYKDYAAPYLTALGISEEELDAMIEEVNSDEEAREAYRESLYGAGDRDSDFVLEVDLGAYVEASL